MDPRQTALEALVVGVVALGCLGVFGTALLTRETAAAGPYALTFDRVVQRTNNSASPLHMTMIFLFGGLSVPSVLGDNRAMTGAILAIATVAARHHAPSAQRMRWAVVGRVTEGKPVIVFENGRWGTPQMSASRVTKQDVMSEVRQNDLTRIDDVEIVILKHNEESPSCRSSRTRLGQARPT